MRLQHQHDCSDYALLLQPKLLTVQLKKWLPRLVWPLLGVLYREQLWVSD